MFELLYWGCHLKTRAMTLVIALVHVLILFLIAVKANKIWNHPHERLYWPALSFKVAMALSVGLVYGFYYPGHDTWTYFKDAEQLANLAKNDFAIYSKAMFDSDANMASYHIISNTEWRSVFFVKVLSVFCLFTNNNYWICAAWLAMISFFASWNIHKVICDWKPHTGFASALAFLFFPSVSFWGSGLEKETLALGGLLFVSASLIEFWHGKKLNFMKWILIFISLLLIWKLRYFWLGVYLLVIIPTLIVIYLLRKKVSTYVSTLIVIGIFMLVFFGLPYLHPNFSSDLFLGILVTNNQQFTTISNPNNIIRFYQLKPEWSSVIINSPWALASGLFRPFIWEAPGLLGFFASIENAFLLVMTLFSLPSLKKALGSKDSILLVSTIIYISVLCIFLTLSTPNFGSLSRYRIGFLPFFVFIICISNPLVSRIQKMFKVKSIQ